MDHNFEKRVGTQKQPGLGQQLQEYTIFHIKKSNNKMKQYLFLYCYIPLMEI